MQLTKIQLTEDIDLLLWAGCMSIY